jgi:hypothetical protein
MLVKSAFRIKKVDGNFYMDPKIIFRKQAY